MNRESAVVLGEGKSGVTYLEGKPGVTYLIKNIYTNKLVTFKLCKNKDSLIWMHILDEVGSHIDKIGKESKSSFYPKMLGLLFKVPINYHSWL